MALNIERKSAEEMWRCQPPTTLTFVVNDDDNLKSTTVFNCMAIIFMCALCVCVTIVHYQRTIVKCKRPTTVPQWNTKKNCLEFVCKMRKWLRTKLKLRKWDIENVNGKWWWRCCFADSALCVLPKKARKKKWQQQRQLYPSPLPSSLCRILHPRFGLEVLTSVRVDLLNES